MAGIMCIFADIVLRTSRRRSLPVESSNYHGDNRPVRAAAQE